MLLPCSWFARLLFWRFASATHPNQLQRYIIIDFANSAGSGKLAVNSAISCH
jgi:hypothetical protein